MTDKVEQLFEAKSTKKIDINVGDKFGMLTIMKEAERQRTSSGASARAFMCKCNCGKEKIIRLANLRHHKTLSCGCYNDSQRKNGLARKHGLINTKSYYIWQGMKDRCFNEKNKRYVNYGGRGITVCERWMEFKRFQEDIGKNLVGDMSIDRVNPNGNYCPENCRVIPMREQSKTRRSTVFYEHNGKSMILGDWEKELGFSKGFIRNRIKSGMTFEEAITKKKYSKPLSDQSPETLDKIAEVICG